MNETNTFRSGGSGRERGLFQVTEGGSLVVMLGVKEEEAGAVAPVEAIQIQGGLMALMTGP